MTAIITTNNKDKMFSRYIERGENVEILFTCETGEFTLTYCDGKLHLHSAQMPQWLDGRVNK